MANITKQFLSGSINGRPIDVTATASPGNIIHTAHATSIDEIYIYANSTNGKPILTIEFGGVAISDKITIELKNKKGLVLIVPGVILTNGLVVRAYADIASAVNIVGWVNRIG